jgi:sugar phosphate isomerase/epimerase
MLLFLFKEAGLVRLAAFPKCYLDDIIVHKTMTLFEWIAQAARLGVDGLELHSLFFEGADEAYVARVCAACDAAGLARPMMCFSPDFTQPDPQKRAAELERQKAAIDLTARLGGTYCRTLTGQNRPGLDHKQAVGWCVELIGEAVAYAAQRGVTLTLENHYKDGYWDYPEFALHAEVFLEIVNQIHAPNFGINFDPSNTVVAGEDPLALLETIKARVVTMHASDRYLSGGSLADLRKLEMDPLYGYARIIQHGVIGQGLNDYDAIFGTLKRAGFDGWISIEDGMNGMEELRQSVAFLRSKIKQYFG